MVGTVYSVVADPSSNFFTLKVKTGTNFFALQYVYLVNNTGYAEQMTIENSTEKNP
jgi:rod shape-determining protein MreC